MHQKCVYIFLSRLRDCEQREEGDYVFLLFVALLLTLPAQYTQSRPSVMGAALMNSRTWLHANNGLAQLNLFFSGIEMGG